MRKYFLNAQQGQFLENKDATPRHSFNVIEGHLVNINFKTTAHGEAMRLHIVDQTNFYVISMFVHSRPANAFFMVCPQLDLNQPMKLKIESIEGKEFFSIEQFGGPVLWHWSKENQHELPTTTEAKREYLLAMVQTEIVPVLQKKLNPYPSNQMYKPARKGLHGGYFDRFASSTRFGADNGNHIKHPGHFPQ
jgi:hypothetical protein